MNWNEPNEKFSREKVNEETWENKDNIVHSFSFMSVETSSMIFFDSRFELSVDGSYGLSLLLWYSWVRLVDHPILIT